MDPEQHLIMRSIKYGIDHPEFTDADFQRDVIIPKEYRMLTGMFFSNTLDPNVNALFQLVIERQVTNENGEKSLIAYYSLLPSALFAYLDLMELKQSREFAHESSILARKAINRSTLAIWVAVLIAFAQTVVALLY